MFWNMNLKVLGGFGRANVSPHVVEDVSGVSARTFSIWSLGTPCVRTKDRRGFSHRGQRPCSGRQLLQKDSKGVSELRLFLNWAWLDDLWGLG
jgi:hypothetical protein